MSSVPVRYARSAFAYSLRRAQLIGGLFRKGLPSKGQPFSVRCFPSGDRFAERMFKTINRYILRQVVISSLAMMGIALMALLLERLLRLLDLAANPDRLLSYISQILVTLIPQYLAVALPLAFFLGVLLTFNRLQRDSELTAMTTAGLGLARLIVPVLGFGFALALIAAIIVSFLQPYGRYTYRLLRHKLVHATLGAAIRERTFIHVAGMTFIAEAASADGRQLSKVFVYEEKDDGASIITTARRGSLRGSADGLGTVLLLSDGQRVEIMPDGTSGGTLKFSQYQWRLAAEESKFRARGKDAYELTLPELWAAQSSPPGRVTAAEIAAELHARLVTTATFLVLPLLAVPLALQGGRGGKSYGIAIGLLSLVVYDKVIFFGKSMAAHSLVSPSVGLWLPFAAFAASGAYLSYLATMKVSKGRLAGLPAPSVAFSALRQHFWPERWRET